MAAGCRPGLSAVYFKEKVYFMKRFVVLSGFVVLTAAVIGIGMFTPQKAQAQGGRGGAEAAAARARQEALEASTPKLNITEEVLNLQIPDHTIGETEGVTRISKGHLWVYSRTGKGGSARGGTAAELFEFDQNLKFVKMWAPDNYAASFAHSVRADKYDNIWMVDEGSNMIVKMDPTGRVLMTLGRSRKPSTILRNSSNAAKRKAREPSPGRWRRHLQP